MSINVPRLRAVTVAAVCAQLVAGALTAKAEPARVAPRHAAASRAVQMAAATPLRFFTLADRLAQLKAAGRIPAAGSATPAAATEGETPASPASLGLRLASPENAGQMMLGSLPFPVPGGDLSGKWRQAMARFVKEETVIEGCEAGRCRHPGARLWLEIARAAAPLEAGAQLELVHRRLNAAIRYRTDMEAFGMPDYWASPLEVLGRAGDCEDYAIAKYLMLKRLGFATRDMRIVALRDLASGEFHAILAVRHEEAWVFMDNRIERLSREADYANLVALASVDDDGQSMMVRVAPMPSLRLSML